VDRFELSGGMNTIALNHGEGFQKLRISRMQLSVPNRKASCDGSWKIQK
jgi:hypothetical protein